MKDGVENRLVKKFYMDEDQEAPDIFNANGWEPFDGLIGFSGSGLPGEGLDYYRDAYQRMYGGVPDTPLSEMVYDAVFLAALAATKANASTSPEIRDHVYDIANAPGEKIGPGADEYKRAVDLIQQGQDIDYTGVSGTIEYDDQGQNLTGGSKMWHVDAANKSLPVDGYVLYDAAAGTYTFTPVDGCKFCDPYKGA
jgi:branched-chain amino acid transport system substrate-binding protein